VERSPYRVAERPVQEVEPPPERPDPDGAAIHCIIFVVGLMGVGIGVFSAMRATVEPSIGIVMMIWVARAVWRSRNR
jgi:hypothetical protein